MMLPFFQLFNLLPLVLCQAILAPQPSIVGLLDGLLNRTDDRWTRRGDARWTLRFRVRLDRGLGFRVGRNRTGLE